MIALESLSPHSFPDRHIVALQGGRTRSWAEFCAGVGGTARQLAGCRRVVLTCVDSWNFAIRLFGAMAAGADIILPANTCPATLAALDGRLVDDGFETGADTWHTPLATDCRLIFQTSGSTGAAKPVQRCLGQLSAEVAALHALWGDAISGAPSLATVSHQHAYGLIFQVMWPLAAGRPFVAERPELWEDLLAALPSGAILVSSPAHLTRLGGLAPLAATARPRMVLSAGAMLPAAAADEAARVFGIPVTEIFGSTETGAVATRRRDSGDPPWQPLPGYRIATTAEGLLRLDNPGGAAEIADRIEMLEGGTFRLLGRADRIAKIEGKRVGLDEVELALTALPQVEAAAVLVPADPAPVLAAAVILSPAGRAELETLGAFRLGRALRRLLSGHLEPAAMPRRWRFVDSLPQGPMGKRRAADLAALFEGPARLPAILGLRRPAKGVAEIDLHLPDNLLWFRGHFPGRPILPGVVQLDWVLHFARLHLGLDLPAARRFQVKYKAVAVPGDRLVLELRHDRAKDRLSFSYRRGGDVCSSGSVSLS